MFSIPVLEIGRLLADTNSRVKAVSSCHVRSSWILCLSLAAMFGGAPGSNGSDTPHSPQVTNPQQLFEEGQAALKKGDLEHAERAFRGVIALDPQAMPAYANLGVIAMRRKRWPQALEMLQKAERMAPGVAGIRLNIGLVYYRQGEYRAAIAPFDEGRAATTCRMPVRKAAATAF